MSLSHGNVVDTAKFASHCAAAATASALARTRLGNISPSSTHTSGPHVAPNPTMKRFANSSAMNDHGWGSETPASVVVANENDSAIMPSEIAMTTDPV